jgi:flagellar hook-basal body complex protein FliE
MSVLPIDPAAFGASPAAPTEWTIPGVDGKVPAQGTSGPSAPDAVSGVEASGPSESFGDALAKQIENLTELQVRASEASTALANGTATDAASVVIAVEKAQLAMQLAGQIRTRASEAVADIFHTTV